MARTFRNYESRDACDRTSAGHRSSLVPLTRILIVISSFLILANPLAAQTNSTAQTQASHQRFACYVGYTPRECQVAMTVLRKTLERYPVEALGEWTWVLMRTEDWKHLLAERKFDPNHPVFSYLPKRETFLDGALVVKTSMRGAELSAIWHMSIEDLFDLAIRHELAHALCNEPDETKANRAAIALKNGTLLPCRVTEETSTATPK